MQPEHTPILPGMARLGGELYLKSEHPFKYAQMLMLALEEHREEFTLAIQVGLDYLAEFLREIEHYRFDAAQSGFREYLTFRRRDILEDERLDESERQETIAFLYNVECMNDHLETLLRIVKEATRDDLMRDILRPARES